MSGAYENKGAMAATIVVAASDSLNKAAANYVCDGTADNVEIQAAIDALPAGGGKVMLLEGTFNLAANIDLVSNLKFIGSGPNTILKPSLALGSSIIFGTGLSNVIVEDFVVDADSTSSTGIVFYYSSDITVQRTTVKNVAGATANDGYGYYFLDTDHIFILNITALAIAQRDAVQFKGCHVVMLSGLYVDTATLFAVCAHNSPTPRYMEDVLIENVYATNVQSVLNLSYVTRYTARNIHGYNITRGVYIHAGISRDVKILDSSFQKITADLGINTYYAYEIYDLLIKNCLIDYVPAATKDGILLWPNAGDKIAKNVSIVNCTIKGCSRYGIYAYGTNVTGLLIEGCTIKNCLRGIQLQDITGARITNNDCLDDQDGGITSLLTDDAASGQKNVTVADGTIFWVGQNVTIADLTPLTENNVIDSINGNVLTMLNNLANTYTVAQSGNVTGLATQVYGIAAGGNSNSNIFKSNRLINNSTSGITVVGLGNSYDQSPRSVALDLSGAATDVVVFQANVPCILCGYDIFYTEASSADAGVNTRIGRYQDGVALDDDYFDLVVSEVSKALGYHKSYVTADLTNKVIAAGDTVTVGTAGGKTGTGEVMIVLHIAEMAD